jgi:hypothetical protein
MCLGEDPSSYQFLNSLYSLEIGFGECVYERTLVSASFSRFKRTWWKVTRSVHLVVGFRVQIVNLLFHYFRQERQREGFFYALTDNKRQFKKTPKVKSKANVMLILSIFFNQKSSNYFLRKTYSNLTRHLQFLNPRPIFWCSLTFCIYCAIESQCHSDSKHIFDSKIIAIMPT